MNCRLLVISVLSLVVGCQKELPIDVPNTAGRPVIEANISSPKNDAIVRLTRSVNLTSRDTAVIDDAIVELINVETSRRYELPYLKSGYYVGHLPFPARSGQRWALSVTIELDTYLSTVTVPTVVAIDSTQIEKMPPIFGVESQVYTVYIWLKDPEGTDYYQINAWVNGFSILGISVFNDLSFNGRAYAIPYRVTLNKGDVLMLELQHIAAEIYQYYFELKQTLNPLSNSPSNPTSNIVQTSGPFANPPLGYFSAAGESRTEIRVR